MKWTKKQLVGTCSRLRDSVLARDLARTDELAGAWPNDCGCAPARRTTCPKCRSATKDAWWLTHGQLVGFRMRAEVLDLPSDQADEHALQALATDPQPFRFLYDPKTEVEIHPKGYDALRFIHRHDWCALYLEAKLQVLEGACEDRTLNIEVVQNPVDVMEAIEREIGWQTAIVLAAILYPGPDYDREHPLDPPTEYRDINPLDMGRLQKVYMRVSLPSKRHLDLLTGPRKADGSGRIHWSVFFSQLGNKLNEDPQHLMRNRSLASLLTQVQLAQPREEVA